MGTTLADQWVGRERRLVEWSRAGRAGPVGTGAQTFQGVVDTLKRGLDGQNGLIIEFRHAHQASNPPPTRVEGSAECRDEIPATQPPRS